MKQKENEIRVKPGSHFCGNPEKSHCKEKRQVFYWGVSIPYGEAQEITENEKFFK